MNSETALRALSALSNTHRLAVFRLLVRAGGTSLSQGDIARATGLSPTGLTFHMKELERARLVRLARDGRFVRASIEVAEVRALVRFLTEDCCGGRPDLCGGFGPSCNEASPVTAEIQTGETSR